MRRPTRFTSRDMTEWAARDRVAPLSTFLRTESGSAGVLVIAVAVAVLWATVDVGSYERTWATHLAIKLGESGVDLSLRDWVNSGLMTFFFIVVGLETRREIDLGELRDRRRLVLPAVAGLSGMAVPVVIFLIITRGTSATWGWAVAMSTDTALALGALALVGRTAPARTRVFLLSMIVIDDLVALVVIAAVYSDDVAAWPLAVAGGLFLMLVGGLRAGIDVPMAYAVLGVGLWLAFLRSGVDPVVTGLVVGLTAAAYAPARASLEQASGLFRLYREQPTARLAREAALGLTATLSPNERLQRFYHPWTSYVIVPIFGLANAGVSLDPAFVGRALASPVTWGIVVAYLVGKPAGVVGSSVVMTWASSGRFRPSVGWASLLGSGTAAGVAFTVSLLIANLAFEGRALEEVRLGVVLTLLGASLLTWLVFASTRLMDPKRRALALLGDIKHLTDLAAPVDLERDHVRGASEPMVTIVEYGDFECRSCGRAEAAINQSLLAPDVRHVWRHLPIPEVHPNATRAAEAAEAAAAQGKFWEYHDLLLAHQNRLSVTDLLHYADVLGLDRGRFEDELARHTHAGKVARDVASADLSNVSGTPTFYINGRRHYGAHDVRTMLEATRVAREQAAVIELGSVRPRGAGK
jgi:Na+/H+ antiporter NhaA